MHVIVLDDKKSDTEIVLPIMSDKEYESFKKNNIALSLKWAKLKNKNQFILGHENRPFLMRGGDDLNFKDRVEAIEWIASALKVQYNFFKDKMLFIPRRYYSVLVSASTKQSNLYVFNKFISDEYLPIIELDLTSSGVVK